MGWLDTAIQEKERDRLASQRAKDGREAEAEHLASVAIGTIRGFDEIARMHLGDAAAATWTGTSYSVTPEFQAAGESLLREHMALESSLPAYVWLAVGQRSIFRVTLYLNSDAHAAYFRSDNPPSAQPTADGLGQNFPPSEEGLEQLLLEEFRAGPRPIPGAVTDGWVRSFGR